jgi:hypothetical protein
MTMVSTSLLEKGTQALFPSPDLIPATNKPTLTRNSHSDWHMEWVHLRLTGFVTRRQLRLFRAASNPLKLLSANLREAKPIAVL